MWKAGGKWLLMIPHRMGSGQCVPCAAPAAVEHEMPLRDQLAKVLLQRISACASQFHDVADGHSSVLTGVFYDAQRQLRHGRKNDLLSFDFLRQTLHLLL